MKPVEFGVDLTLKAGASVENFKIKTMNCSPYDQGVANGRDNLPANPVVGQMFHSSVDDRIYRWGVEHDNDINAPVVYNWFPIADEVSQFGFDELSAPGIGAGYYRFNVAANEGSVRQAFEDVSAIGAAFYEMCTLKTLNLDNATTPFEIQVIVQQGYIQTQIQLTPYVVNNPYAARVIRVKNPVNFPVLYNDTIPVVTGDILLPKYIPTNGSWTYEVVRRYNNGGTINGDLIISNGYSIGYGNSATRTETLNDAGQTAGKSGFFEAYDPVNFPTGASSWWHLISARHSNLANNYAMQIAGSFFDQKIFFRKVGNNGGSLWREFVTKDSNGSVCIGGDALPSAIFQLDSTTKGFLCPRMTTAQINAIASPSTGLQVYNTTLNTMCFFNGSSWQKVTSTAM